MARSVLMTCRRCEFLRNRVASWETFDLQTGATGAVLRAIARWVLRAIPRNERPAARQVLADPFVFTVATRLLTPPAFDADCGRPGLTGTSLQGQRGLSVRIRLQPLAGESPKPCVWRAPG